MRINRHVDHLCLRHSLGPISSLRFHGDMRGDRRPADTGHLRPEAHDFPHADRLVKLDSIHGDGDDHRQRPPLAENFVNRADRAGLVDVAKQHAAEDGAEGVGVARHHDDLHSEVAFRRKREH